MLPDRVNGCRRVMAADRLPPARSAGLAFLPLALLAALGLLNTWASGDRGAGIDFYQFWAVGQAVNESLVENIYAPEARPRMAGIFSRRALEDGSSRIRAAARFRREEIQAASTPLLYSFFYLVQSGEFERDIRRYRLLSLGCFVLAVLAICRVAGYGPEGTLIVLAFASWTFLPVQDDLRDGNVNQIQLALIALSLWLRRAGGPAWRDLLSGAVLGLAIAFKPNLALVAVVLGLFWAIGGRFRTLSLRGAGIAAGLLIAVAGSSVFFGSVSCWGSWLSTLRHLDEQFDVAVGWGNFGGARLLRDWLGLNLSPALFLLTTGLVGVCAWGGRRREAASGSGSTVEASAARDELLMVGLGLLVPLLAAGLAWPHYLVLAIPICVYLMRPAEGRATRALPAFLGIVCLCSTPILQAFKIEGDYLHASTLALGSAILFGVGCWEAWSRGDRVIDGTAARVW